MGDRVYPLDTVPWIPAKLLLCLEFTHLHSLTTAEPLSLIFCFYLKEHFYLPSVNAHCSVSSISFVCGKYLKCFFFPPSKILILSESMPLWFLPLSLPSFFALASCVSYALMLTWSVFSPVLCLFVGNLTNAIVSTWRAEHLRCYLKKKIHVLQISVSWILDKYLWKSKWKL